MHASHKIVFLINHGALRCQHYAGETCPVAEAALDYLDWVHDPDGEKVLVNSLGARIITRGRRIQLCKLF